MFSNLLMPSDRPSANELRPTKPEVYLSVVVPAMNEEVVISFQTESFSITKLFQMLSEFLQKSSVILT